MLLVLCGCSYSKPLLTVAHADGTGITYYRSIHAGGVLRPGVVVIVAETVGSNPPTVIMQASGSPILPSAVQMSGMVGAAATLGATLRPDETHNTSTTTLNQVEPRGVPSPPSPPSPPSIPSRPPFGPPPWQGQHPNNRGH